MNEGIKFIPITGYSSHMSVNIDDTVNEDREMKNLNLENITKFLSEEDFARVKLVSH